MRRAVGFTFTGQVHSSDKITAPFRISQISEGTDAASALLVGDEIVQVDGLKGLPCYVLAWKTCEKVFLVALHVLAWCLLRVRCQWYHLYPDAVPAPCTVNSSLDVSALRKVILANPAPSVTVEVKRGDASHKVFVLRKRVLKKKKSLVGEVLEPACTPERPGGQEAADVGTKIDTPISGTRHSHRPSALQGPPISAPPPPPRSHELSNEGSLHMQMERGYTHRSMQHDAGTLPPGFPSTPHSCSSANKCEKGQGWLSESPSIGTTGSPTASSSTHRHSSVDDVESAVELQPGRRDIQESELACSVNDLSAQREVADALLIRVVAFKKKMSATARFFFFPTTCGDLDFWLSHVFALSDHGQLPRASSFVLTVVFCARCHCWNAHLHHSLLPLSRSITVKGSAMEEWDNNMRVMRNEIFSMCGLLAEAEGELIAALERTDEGVHYVTSILSPETTHDVTGGSDSGEPWEGRRCSDNLKREDYLQCHDGLERCHANLEKSITTCRNCILALEDDFHSISEQVTSDVDDFLPLLALFQYPRKQIPSMVALINSADGDAILARLAFLICIARR